jgi:hypothetical protein
MMPLRVPTPTVLLEIVASDDRCLLILINLGMLLVDR